MRFKEKSNARTHRPLQCVEEYRLAPEHLSREIRDQQATSRKRHRFALRRWYPLLDIAAHVWRRDAKMHWLITNSWYLERELLRLWPWSFSVFISARATLFLPFFDTTMKHEVHYLAVNIIVLYSFSSTHERTQAIVAVIPCKFSSGRAESLIRSLSRDSRLSDEARTYIMHIAEHFPPPKSFSLALMRERSENIHVKINEQLLGTFQGTQEERTVKVNDGTGRIDFEFGAES